MKAVFYAITILVFVGLAWFVISMMNDPNFFL